MIKLNVSMQILLFLQMLEIAELSLNLIKWVWNKKVWACVVYLIVLIVGMKEMNLRLWVILLSLFFGGLDINLKI